MSWFCRIVVVIVALVAFLIALFDKEGTIMSLVSNAWGIFGAAFGPVILLSLFWKNFNFIGAIAGIATGAVADLLWLNFLTEKTGIYEIIPAFIISLIFAIVVTKLTGGASDDIKAHYEKSLNYTDPEEEQ